MIQFILGLFGLRNKLKKIQGLSDGALAQFKETLHKLKATEKHIADHHDEQNTVIDKANKIKESLIGIQMSNAKVIAKLEEFLA